MKIILSPAKKMNMDTDSLPYQSLPAYLDRTQEILSCLQKKSDQELKKLWGCNDSIAHQNIQRLEQMQLDAQLTPAILSYEGIAYQYMAPAVFESAHLDYVQEHLRILSGFYGVLKPMDGVRPYRLEMQAKLKIGTSRDLYDFWGDTLYDAVSQDDVIINLASKEYSKCIEKYLQEKDRYITCVFAEMVNGKLVQKGTFAKMARGEMVRFMAEFNVQTPEEIKQFDRLGYCYRQDLSSDTQYIFERTKGSSDHSND